MPAIQEPSLHLALTLDLDGTPLFQQVRFAQPLPNRIRHLNSPVHAVGFHEAGSCHNVSPQVIDKFALTDDTSDDWAGADANADLQLVEALLIEAVHGLEHVQRHV